jgi:hypothetical protein
VDIASFSSFSSFDKSRHAERRMIGRYLEHFEEFLQFSRSGTTVLSNQANLAEDLKARFDSVVEATCWDVFPGMTIVLAVLDDAEFGKDIKWFFSPQVKDFIDFKLLLVFVEASMELMLIAVQEPDVVRNFLDTPEADVPIVERGAIRSPSYCFNFDSSNIVPDRLNEILTFIDKIKVDSPFDALFIHDAVFKKPIFCWQIINNVIGCIARDVACMGGGLDLRLNKPLPGTGAFSSRLIAMAKIQLEILTNMLMKHLDRDST